MNGLKRRAVFATMTIMLVCSGISSSIVAQSITVVSTLVDADALARPHDVELVGDLAFVPGKGGSLAIIDIADPASHSIL